MLVINVNEPEIVKACENAGIPFVVEAFTPGDIKNRGETFVVERKGFRDFWSSMVDRRIYEQTKEMYETYTDNRYVFVEVGTLADLAEEYDQNINWIYSLFGEIENWNVKFREYNDMNDLVRKCYSLDAKLGTERKVRDRIVKLYGLTPAEKALSQFPGIGKEKAKAMLKHMKTFTHVVNAVYTDNDKLAEIHGIKIGGKILTGFREELDRTHA
jgi:ERCC4-type nuclease